MKISNLQKVKVLAEKRANIEGALVELRGGQTITVQVGQYKMPATRSVLAPAMERILVEMLEENGEALRAVGVEP